MKRSLISIGLASTFLLTAGTSFAATVQNSSGKQVGPRSQNVWVAKDVTQQDGYKLVYKTFDKNRNVISTRTVTPPVGSLVEFTLVPLTQAIADGDEYVQSVGSGIPSHSELQKLHHDLFQKLNPLSSKQTNSTMDTSLAATGMQEVTGQFAAYNATINYQVDWNDIGGGLLDLYDFSTWQSSGPGHAWEKEIDYEGGFQFNWNNTQPEITSSSSGITWETSGNTQAGTGQQFDTYVTGSNFWGTTYEGYVTLN